MEKKIVNLQVNDNIDETSKSVGSLRSQLRAAQQEVAELSEKFGATSKEAVEAAKKAAILKDTIGDAKALTDAFNPDAKFNALSSSLSGVANGFAAYQGALGLVGVESKELEQQLLKVQSAMAIAQGLQGLGEARDSFKQLKAVGVNAFNAIKTAIGGTGIGLIVVAAGAIYAYWEDIKETVSSVSAEQKKLNELSKTNLETEQKKLSTIGDQDNVLKLQGKSEKEILKIKLAQTDQVIKASEIQIQQSIATTKAQTEAAKRNQEILAGILKFVSVPITLILQTVDAVGKALGKDFGLESKTFTKLSSFVFDPKQTQAEGDAVVAEQRKALDKLRNDRAGLQLSINSIDKQASDEANKLRIESNKSEEKALEEIKRRKQEEIDFQITLNNADRERKVAEALEKEEADAKVLADATAMTDALSAENERRLDNEKKVSEDSIKNAQAEAEAKRNINNIAIQSAQGLVGILASLGEKNKGIQRAALLANSALSIAEIINNTNVGGSKEVATKGIFGLSTSAVLYARMAVSIGSVLAATAKGLRGLGGGSAGSAGAAASAGNRGGSQSASQTPTPISPTFNVVGTSGQNQIAQTLGNQRPVRAFVVSNDVSTAQALDRNIVKTATLGN